MKKKTQPVQTENASKAFIEYVEKSSMTLAKVQPWERKTLSPNLTDQRNVATKNLVTTSTKTPSV